MSTHPPIYVRTEIDWREFVERNIRLEDKITCYTVHIEWSAFNPIYSQQHMHGRPVQYYTYNHCYIYTWFFIFDFNRATSSSPLAHHLIIERFSISAICWSTCILGHDPCKWLQESSMIYNCQSQINSKIIILLPYAFSVASFPSE